METNAEIWEGGHKSLSSSEPSEMRFPGLTISIAKKYIGGDAATELIQFIGSIGYENCSMLSHSIRSILPQLGPNIILKIDELETINTVGVAMIFSLFQHTREQKGNFMLVGPNAFLREIFILVQLPERIQIIETLDEAARLLQ